MSLSTDQPVNQKTIDVSGHNTHALDMQNNVFLEGNFAPIEIEHTLSDPAAFEIRGRIPKDLNGTYFRNGPNPAQKPGKFYHWFLGDGMVHAFSFSRGKVVYSNRYVRTPTFEFEQRAKKGIFLHSGPNILAQISLLGGNILSLLNGLVRSGNADVYTKLIAKSNTSVFPFHERLYALVESSPPMQLNPMTLETLGFEDFDSKFVAPFTAHPKIDPQTGYLYSFGYRVGGTPKLEYFVINPSGKLVSRTPVDLPYYSMVHDFMITRNYAVIPVMPAVASVGSLKRGRVAEWKPEKGAYIYVLPKSGEAGAIRKFDFPVCYIYHYANAFENDQKIIFDAVKYDSLPLLGDDADIRAELFERRNNGMLTRYTLDLVSGEVQETPVSTEYFVEFPVIDPRLVGEKFDHVFAGAAAGHTAGGLFDKQVAFHHNRGKVRTEESEFPSGHFGGEPLFIPTGKINSLKGYLLNIIYDSANNRSYLAIYDAARIDKKPVCEIRLPHRIPYGFHGTWRASRV
jgi:carotenoid cleavage dioxygenase-like enzyme